MAVTKWQGCVRVARAPMCVRVRACVCVSVCVCVCDRERERERERGRCRVGAARSSIHRTSKPEEGALGAHSSVLCPDQCTMVMLTHLTCTRASLCGRAYMSKHACVGGGIPAPRDCTQTVLACGWYDLPNSPAGSALAAGASPGRHAPTRRF